MEIKKQQLELDLKQWIGSKLGKESTKAVYCLPALFKFYTEYIIWNSGLDDSQAGIKIALRNSKLRYADGTTLIAQSKEELKTLLKRVKKLN